MSNTTMGYEDKIIDAIQAIVDNTVANANFDKTIQAVISRVVDETIGKYVVKYQDSAFFAYSTNTENTYSVGSSVYVLIPNNDMSRDKTILGSVEKLGVDYVNNISEENKYQEIGSNIITSTDEFGLCSYKNPDSKILYDKANNINIVGLNADDANIYIKQSSSLIFGAAFKTAIPNEQKFKGNYGLSVDLLYADNATGADIVRTYTIDIDSMNGNPYNFTSYTNQNKIYTIDGENFKSIEKVQIFAYGFPNQRAEQPNDIFIKNIQLFGAERLSEDELSSCALTFITPKGIYFTTKDLDTDFRNVQAQVRVKGKIVDRESQTLEYYWFKENNSILKDSEKYNKLGGNGWECLNDFNTISEVEGETYIEWLSGSYENIFVKKDNLIQNNKYKCVAVYNKETILSKEFTIFNYDTVYTINISSLNGTEFYFDLGKTDLECNVTGGSAIDFTYIWSVSDNNNETIRLEETTEANQIYNDAVTEYNDLLTQIEDETITKESVQSDLDRLEQLFVQYEHVMRVEKNHIYNLPAKDITLFSNYKCSVFSGALFIGTGSIKITNELENNNEYRLVINNGNKVYKYNEAGVAPTSTTLENPITIMPLSFKLYDNKGNLVENDAIGATSVRWIVPNTDTLINVLTSYGVPVSDDINGAVYNGYDLGYSIAPRYNIDKDNNTIQLQVDYKGKTLTANTNLSFLKEGESGTNGTEYVCKIIPNTNDVFNDYPMVIYNVYEDTFKLNYTPISANLWFKAQLWKDGEKIYEGTISGLSDENKNVNISWSNLLNKYSSTITDKTNFEINNETGIITVDTTDYENPANIIKCSINYDGHVYYTTMPIIFVKVSTSDYDIKLLNSTGFRYAVYSADGQSPLYDDTYPFELAINQIVDGTKTDISRLESSDLAVDYDWSVKGEIYNLHWQSEQNLIIKNLLRDIKNQKRIIPIDSYNGLCLNNALFCNITRGDSFIGSIHIPIHLYLNKYGNSALNGWDGNSISINDDEGIILAPQIGAGKKEDDNSFTGVFMGSVQKDSESEIQTGLFGYNKGIRSLELNAEDGSAKFGNEGSGQIVIAPNEGVAGHAYLRSGDYELLYERVSSTSKYTNLDLYFRKENNSYIELKPTIDYTVGQTISESNIYKLATGGSGLEIDLTDPHIRFGSGKFRVDSDGSVHATEYATVVDLDDVKESLSGSITDLETSISYLDISSSGSSINLPCSNLRFPLSISNLPITFTATYKGKTVKLVEGTGIGQSTITIAETHPGIGCTKDFTNSNQRLIFSFSPGLEISDLVNDYTITFVYKASETDSYTVTKKISVVLALQGATGPTGPQGDPGKDGSSVTIQGTYATLADLIANHPSGNTLGDGYIIGNDLYIYTNEGGGSGSLAAD